MHQKLEKCIKHANLISNKQVFSSESIVGRFSKKTDIGELFEIFHRVSQSAVIDLVGERVRGISVQGRQRGERRSHLLNQQTNLPFNICHTLIFQHTRK